MAELLLELFCEEIPARMQARAAADLQRLFMEALATAGINGVKARVFATPRRLALVIDNLPLRQPDREEIKRGPREGAPENAIEGFLRSAGLTRKQLTIEESPKGRFYVATIAEKGKPTAKVIADILPAIIRNFPWPKSMRWGEGELRWVRPLHSILCILDGKVVPFEVDGIKSGNVTSGHRFMARQLIKVKNFSGYKAALQKAFVILDGDGRKEIIREKAQKLAAQSNARFVADETLLDEVAGLVEWPVPLMGSFDASFLDIPHQVLTSTMRANQKYFSLQNAKTGKLLSRFIVIANLKTKNGGKAIVAGNERVLAARLSDAKFFWDQDLKVRLEDRLPKLKDIIFHTKLGSQAARVTRLEKLAANIAGQMGADRDKARLAARLAKTDLVSGTVGEFPEVQGVIGGMLAGHENLGADIAQAITDHYKPAGPADDVPAAPVSIALALADKLDILAGFWAIDEKPTGSKDPYALRRAALGIIRLVLANKLRLPLLKAFAAAIENYPSELGRNFSGKNLMEFFAERLKVYLREQGARHDLVDAVFALEHQDDLTTLVNRVEALGAFLATDDGANLLAGYNRAANILRIEEKKDGQSYAASVDVNALTQTEEKALAQAIEKTHTKTGPALARQDFKAAMTALAGLRAPVDVFFDKITVNADDKEIRSNRLRLLSGIRAAVDSIADFSRIEG